METSRTVAELEARNNQRKAQNIASVGGLLSARVVAAAPVLTEVTTSGSSYRASLPQQFSDRLHLDVSINSDKPTETTSLLSATPVSHTKRNVTAAILGLLMVGAIAALAARHFKLI